MINDYQIGAFRGRKLKQRKGVIGGARSVFVKLQGIKNELTYPTFGGKIMNPFKGAAKMFAGDLLEYRTDENGMKPKIYILKTYKVAKATTTASNVTIVRSEYSHIPFVGDKIGSAPTSIGGAMTELTVNKVEAKNDSDGNPIWELTLSATASFKLGEVLVEGDGSGKMMVKNINAVADADMDMLDAPSTSDEDFEGARYLYTPSLGGVMYINRMSPMPACVLAKNESKVKGWFKIQF